MAISKELWTAYTRIFFVESAYWIVSIGMVFVNEFVLSDKLLTDDLTVFITIFQILFSLSILVSLNYLTKKYLQSSRYNPLPSNDDGYEEDYEATATTDSKLNEDSSIGAAVDTTNRLLSDQMSNDNARGNINKNVETITIKRPYESAKGDKSPRNKAQCDQDGLMQLFIINIPERVNLETCKIVFPLSILYIGMLLLNNFCLKYVGVAFYFVSRSLTTVFNVTFTYFLINEPVSRGALVCCGFIVLGFILGIDQESVIGSLSVIGVIFGIASSLFTSLFSIYTKKTLAKLERNIWTLILYNNMNAILLCTPLLLVHGDIHALIVDKWVSPSFWSLLAISGVMAFFISIVTNASIKYTSPLTHNISGTAKACLQTVIAVIYYHDHKSALWWLSNLTILVASAFYSRIKQKEMERKSSATAGAQQHELPAVEQGGGGGGALTLKARADGRERKHSAATTSSSGRSETTSANSVAAETDEGDESNLIVLFSRAA